MAVFIVIWHLASIWLIVIIGFKDKIRNYYRLKCHLKTAHYVQVSENKESVIMTQSKNSLVLKMRQLDSYLKRYISFDANISTCKITIDNDSSLSSSRKYFEYHCMRFVLGENGLFQNNQHDLGSSHQELLTHKNGLTTAQATQIFSYVGENFVRVNVPTYAKALFDEIVTYFYLYQMMCLWVWFYFNYFKMGLVQFCVILISAIFKAYLRVNSEKRIKILAEQQDTCLVLRDGKWVKLSSKLLVPGDIISVRSGTQLTCDAAVLKGEIIVDESSLTGEAMPVRKFPLKQDNIPFEKMSSGRIYTVFAGTHVLQCSSDSKEDTAVNNSLKNSVISKGLDLSSTESEKPYSSLESDSSINKNLLACDENSDTADLLDRPIENANLVQILVLSTRVNTNKGMMIQKIMFPSEYSFVFNEHLRIVIPILLIWGAIGFGLTIWLMGHDLTSWFYGIFIISQILSPLLPAAFVIGQSVAANRLKKNNIFCIDLPRIMVAGKVKVFCFDKTGTLTREGLEFNGAQEVSSSNTQPPHFKSPQEDISLLNNISQIGLASCHAVTMVGETLIGNPVDIEQFRSTDWEIIGKGLSKSDENDQYLDTLISPYLETKPNPNRSHRKVVHVVKRFEFEHARQSMSVAVLDPDTNHVHVYVKGSFEKLKNSSLNSSIPENYDLETSKWASEGCYLLAMAHKDIGVVEDISSLNSMSREQMESGCSLILLLMFRNMLKDDTPAALQELRKGNTRCVMITGDNALTGIHIAKTSGMVSENSRIILGDMETSGLDGNKYLVWRDPKTREIIQDIDELLLNDNRSIDFNEDKIGDLVLRRTANIELAVTAASFDYLTANDLIRKYLFDIRVFSRMTPEGKVTAVRLHMEKAVTAMCGDGGNDCGALRAAHVGLALSESDASIVSPFSSSDRSIFSCVNLLIHGRTALSTSFSAYKFLIMYGETMAWLELFQFYFSVIVPESVWIFIDSFIAVGLLFALTQSKPAKNLKPFRPTARLLGFNTMLSTVGQVLINFLAVAFIFVILYRQSWFRCHEFDSRDIDTSLWWLLGDNYEAETLSILLLTQFVNAAGVFNLGYRFRQSWYKNYLLVFFYTLFLTIISFVCLADPNWLGCLFRINCGDPDVLVSLGYKRPSFKISNYNSPIGHNVFPREYRIKFWLYALCNVLIVFLFEFLVVLGPVGRFIKKRFAKPSSTNDDLIKL
ncbi:putative cation-transporting ATPase 13A3 [Smittium culicis]|uniref:Putative cation-transporting ATPase 13A3 n=1 Tax=Smittium culicis TaxID=133412 RepID=A0A1R1X375_9FUNG|nr:putative cation-transporting ATPase 13A3 [Smittium culicis]